MDDLCREKVKVVEVEIELEVVKVRLEDVNVIIVEFSKMEEVFNDMIIVFWGCIVRLIEGVEDNKLIE